MYFCGIYFFKVEFSFAKWNSLFQLTYGIRLTENNDSVRRGLGGDASGGSAVINNQEMVPDLTGKALPVGGGDTGAGGDIQFQLFLHG